MYCGKATFKLYELTKKMCIQKCLAYIFYDVTLADHRLGTTTESEA
jgi:hypothetical protein